MNDYRILVVDDEEDLCEILKFNLENEGYEVDTANSAEEALRMDIGSYSLLLLDVMMGEISGFKMASMLKKDKKTAQIPIIFITAKDTENDTVTGFNLGADDYISKPFSLREVAARVKAVLRRTRQGETEHAPEQIVYKTLVLDIIKKKVCIDGEEAPLSFWTDADIWEYIRTYDIPYCKIYDMGYVRTGCIFCMFGVHLDSEPNRFQRLQRTHPQLWRYCMKQWDKGGLGMREVLEYMGVPYENFMLEEEDNV